MSNKRELKYLSRDFTGFMSMLREYTKTYFPTTYNDFGEADPGTMFMEHVASIGDNLSFYLDKNIQENFSAYAQEKSNLLAEAYAHGYFPKVTSTAVVDIDVYQQIPALISASVSIPDYSYCLIVEKEAKIKSRTNSNVIFVTQNLVDFSFSSSADPTDISVYSINGDQPEYYLLKKTVKAVAGTIKSEDFTFGDPKKFDSITLQDNKIIQILDVVDSDGNKWYEVPYLAQSTIFEEVHNNQLNDPFLSRYNNDTPYILRLQKVQRRFVARFDAVDKLNLEFGSGVVTNPDEVIIPNSDNVGMGIVDSISKMNKAYDPSNFLYTKDYGIAPSNTTLTIRYLSGGGVETNVPSNDISQPYEYNVSTVSITPSVLNQGLLDYIKNTVIFNNEKPSSGGGDGDSIEDLRNKIVASFPTQMRSVTPEDHVIRVLSMPPKFGTVAKAYITQDIASNNSGFIDNNPLALSLYVLSYDVNKRLTNASLAIKENIKTYIKYYLISNDAINIKNAFYINIGISFEIIALPAFNSREVLSSCLDAVKEHFKIDNWQIGQRIVLSEIYNLIGKIKGVQSVNKVKIINKYGVESGYSDFAYDIEGATRSGVIYNSIDPACFEVRFPNNDIQGRIVTY